MLLYLQFFFISQALGAIWLGGLVCAGTRPLCPGWIPARQGCFIRDEGAHPSPWHSRAPRGAPSSAGSIWRGRPSFLPQPPLNSIHPALCLTSPQSLPLFAARAPWLSSAFQTLALGSASPSSALAARRSRRGAILPRELPFVFPCAQDRPSP